MLLHALARQLLAAAEKVGVLSQLLNQRCNEQIYRAISSLATIQAKAKP